MNTSKTPRFSARKKNLDHMFLLETMIPFKAEVEALRDKFGIMENGRNIPGSHAKWMDHVAPRIQEYIRAVNALVEKYNLPQNFAPYVKRYVEEGLRGAPLNNFDITPVGYPAKALSVNVYTKLTQKELEDMIVEIKRMNEALPSFGAIKNIEELAETEYYYEECESYNRSELREYTLTIKEQDKRNADRHYENMRTLRKKREERFGKK